MLSDLIFAPPQMCGAFRLVPLLRERPRLDLRLAKQDGPGFAGYDLGKTTYVSYIPHAFILEWRPGDAPTATLGTQLGKPQTTSPVPGRKYHRMAKREADNRLRFLPLHLAMEGFLALHFGGPAVQWGDFSRQFVSHGQSPRIEESFSGWALKGFEDALRVFEIHEGQVGVLVFVADALASAFVTPHPDDYRALHQSLLEDFFGELIWQYAVMYSTLPPADPKPAEGSIQSLDDIRRVIEGMRTDWADFSRTAAVGLLDVPVQTQSVYRAGPFELQRFISDLDPSRENHIGERIVAPDGSIQYLKTFRLSANQTRRAYLLDQLARHDWNIESMAAERKLEKADMMLRFEQAGFGWIFQQHILDAAREAIRKRT